MLREMTSVDSLPAPKAPQANGGAVVRASGISKYYGDFMAVGDLDLEVTEGEILGIIDHNGAGKTTTLKMLTGLVAMVGVSYLFGSSPLSVIDGLATGSSQTGRPDLALYAAPPVLLGAAFFRCTERLPAVQNVR